jgi:hypothetical protein
MDSSSRPWSTPGVCRGRDCAMHLPAAEFASEVPDLTDIALTDLWSVEGGELRHFADGLLSQVLRPRPNFGGGGGGPPSRAD